MNPIFPDGLIVREPATTAPSFVKCTVLINVENFHNWASKQTENISEKGWLAFDVKESKKGGYYAQLDTWKPAKQSPIGEHQAISQEHEQRTTTQPTEDFPDGINPDDIPF